MKCKMRGSGDLSEILHMLKFCGPGIFEKQDNAKF